MCALIASPASLKLRGTGLCSLTDKVPVFGTGDGGSIPSRGASLKGETAQNKMKKIAAIFIAIVIGFSLFSTAQANDGGILPPCGGVNADGTKQSACTICNLFQLIDNIVKVVIVGLVPAAAGLMIAIAGFKMLINQNNAEVMGESKKIILMVIIGLLLIYGSYAIVGAVFSGMGYYNNINPLQFNNLICN